MKAGRNLPLALFLAVHQKNEGELNASPKSQTKQGNVEIQQLGLGAFLSRKGPDSPFSKKIQLGYESQLKEMRRVAVRTCLLVCSDDGGESRQLRWRHIHHRHQKVRERISVVRTFGIMGSLIISNEYSQGGMHSIRARLC